MYIAQTNQKEIIYADQKEIDTRKGIRCPGCLQPVFLKRGPKVTAHFSHYSNTACNTFSEGETEEHLQGKKQLFEWFQLSGQKIELEAYLPELKQRPDLLWRTAKGEKIAIEFQCSHLSFKRMKERTEGYLKNSYQVIWIVGKSYHISKRFASFQKQFVTKIQDGPICYMQYNVNKKELEILYHIHTHERRIRYVKATLTTSNQAFTSMKSFVYPLNKKPLTFSKINYLNTHKQLLQLSYYHTAKARRFFKVIYMDKEDVLSLPVELYWNVSYEWMVDMYSFEWKYLFLKWIESFPLNRIITLRMLKKWVDQNEKRGRLLFHSFPMLERKEKTRPFIEFLNLLTKSGVVQNNKTEKWTVKKKAKRYTSADEKNSIL